MDGPRGLNWTVQMTESGRSWVKMDGQRGLNWAVLKSKSGLFFNVPWIIFLSAMIFISIKRHIIEKPILIFRAPIKMR